MAVSAATSSILGTALCNQGAANEVVSLLNTVSALSSTEAGYIDGVIAGTAAASKALVLDSNLDVGTVRALTLQRLFYTPVARTATADGLTTGIIADAGMLQFVTVTSSDANHIVVLPTPTPGTIVILWVGANGYELRSSAPASVAINGGSGSNAESAIAANQMVLAICTSATSWHGIEITGATLTAVEAAA